MNPGRSLSKYMVRMVSFMLMVGAQWWRASGYESGGSTSGGCKVPKGVGACVGMGVDLGSFKMSSVYIYIYILYLVFREEGVFVGGRVSPDFTVNLLRLEEQPGHEGELTTVLEIAVDGDGPGNVNGGVAGPLRALNHREDDGLLLADLVRVRVRVRVRVSGGGEGMGNPGRRWELRRGNGH